MIDPGTAQVAASAITGASGLAGGALGKNKDKNKNEPVYSYSPLAQALFPDALAIVHDFMEKKGIKVPEQVAAPLKEEANKIVAEQAAAAQQPRKPMYYSHEPGTPFRPASMAYQPAPNKAAPMPEAEPAQEMPKPAAPPEPPKFSNPVYASQVANPTNEAAMNEYARRAAPTPPPPPQPTPISSYDEENQRRQAAMKMLLSQIYGGGPRL